MTDGREPERPETPPPAADPSEHGGAADTGHVNGADVASDPVDAVLAARRWWLNLQIALALSGGAFWFVGAYLEEDFLSGVGAGLVAAALIMRIGRRAASDD